MSEEWGEDRPEHARYLGILVYGRAGAASVSATVLTNSGE